MGRFVCGQGLVKVEALLCIQSGDSLKNPQRWKFDTDHFYFKSSEEMAQDFPGYEHALRRTLEIAERCNVTQAAQAVEDPGRLSPSRRGRSNFGPAQPRYPCASWSPTREKFR